MLQTTVTGPGTLTFWWELVENGNWDIHLDFDLDGENKNSLYGDSAWAQDGPYTIPPGQHTLSWTVYSDDGSNPAAAAVLDEVSITSQYPPFVSGPVDGNVPGAGYNYQVNNQTGSNSVLVCQVDANPPAVFQWFKNSAAMPGKTNATLVITNAQLSDTGYYAMTASNSLGTTTSWSVYLSIYQTPHGLAAA